MAIDSAQKRMSALNPSSPWRGPMVDATISGFTVGNRMAADYLYSGISAGSASGPDFGTIEWTEGIGPLHYVAGGIPAHWTVTDGPLHWTAET